MTNVSTFVFDFTFTILLVGLSVALHDYMRAAYVPIFCVVVFACVQPLSASMYLVLYK